MKKLLLTATAVGALALAGTASAHDLVFRTGAAGGPIDISDLNTVARADDTQYSRSLVGLYLIASETAAANVGTNTLSLSDLLSDPDGAGPQPRAQLPSGNNLYTITLTNGTFSAPVTSGNLVGANCTIAPSSGGAQGDSTVTFIVSASGGVCEGFSQVNIPVAPASAGLVQVTTRYETDNLVPIDGGDKTLDVIFAIDAFQPAFNATFSTANTGPGAGADTIALIGPATPGGMPYTQLGGDNDLGRLAIYVDTRAQRNLNPGNFVSVADVTTATVQVTGDFSAFNGAGAFPTLTSGTAPLGVTGPVQTFTISGNLASASGAGTADNITQPLSVKPNGSVFEVYPDGGMIPSSDYAASISYTLDPTVYSAQPGAQGDFESIEREGTSFIAPWTGGSQAGSQSVIRLSSTSGASGAVTVVLTNAVATGGVALADDVCSLGPVPADGDLVIGQPQLATCFDAFARGDLIITVEAAPADLTAKMRNTSASGTFETTLGRYSGSTIAGAAN